MPRLSSRLGYTAIVQIRSHGALRGIAALMVVLYHLQYGGGAHLPFETATPLFRRSYLFVDLFFVLSGFIISYANGADHGGVLAPGALRRFWIGRVTRLYPLHLFCLSYLLLFAVPVSLVFAASGRPTPFSWSAHSLAILASQILLLNAWVPGFAGWNVPSWSISAEAVAYLLFPLVVLGIRRVPLLARAVMLVLPLGFYGWVASGNGSLDLTTGLGPARCLAGFLLGMLLFLERERLARLPDWLLSVLQLAAVAALLLDLALPLADIAFVPAAVLLVGSTWADRGLLPRLLSPAPFQWLGEISYSIYLNHVCLTDIIGVLWLRSISYLALPPLVNRALFIATVLTATLGVSWLTFTRVEKPARRRLARRWLGQTPPPIAQSPAAP